MERALSSLGLKNVKSTKDISALPSKQYPANPSDYELLEDCGRGVSATVHRARCIPLNEIVAVKKLNLESMNCNLDEIIHEAQTMKQYNHPNVLPLHCSFVHGEDLWMVMPFITGGSVLHIMKYGYPEGLDEPVIATIMREVLKGLDYVHKHGGIHRDVKAGNILVDTDGSVKLADFGVAATLERGGSWGHDCKARMTFVGTPCWMAPEVMEQTLGYDSSADIWSVGITMLELAHGHAPFSKFPPMKILLMTLHNPPPTLDDKGGKKHFSKLMKDIVARCLQKEPGRRPTAAQLLEHRFFKQARDDKYMHDYVMEKLPPLVDRVRMIRSGKAATSAEENDRRMEISQEEYKKGVSSWNFDIAALKAQAALEPDDIGSGTIPVLSPPPTPSGTPAPGGLSAMLKSVSIDNLQTAPTVASPAHEVQHHPTTSEIKAEFKAAAGAAAAGTAAGGMSSGVASTSSSPAPTPSPGSASGWNSSSANTTLSAFAVPSAAEAVTAAAAAQLSLGTGQADLTPSLSGSLSTERRTQDSLLDGATPVLSPGQTSPSTISREHSIQGGLPATSSVVMLAPKDSITGKKKEGRFKVYAEGEEPPPFSSPPPPSFMEQAGGSQRELQGALSISRSDMRTSDDGAGKSVDGSEGSRPEGSSQVEKKKGRFRVIEEEVPRRISSAMSLNEANKRSDPKATSTSGLGPWRTCMQEMLEQSAAQTSSLLKMMSAAAEAEKSGKLPPWLSRPQAGQRSALMEGPSVLEQLDALQTRVAEYDRRVALLEEENSRLRYRNDQLEQQQRQAAAAAAAAVAAATATAATPPTPSPASTPGRSQSGDAPAPTTSGGAGAAAAAANAAPAVQITPGSL